MNFGRLATTTANGRGVVTIIALYPRRVVLLRVIALDRVATIQTVGLLKCGGRFMAPTAL